VPAAADGKSKAKDLLILRGSVGRAPELLESMTAVKLRGDIAWR